MNECCECWSVNVFILLFFQVVRIQVQIQETLRRQYSQHLSVQGAISQLDSELMDITKVISHCINRTVFTHLRLIIAVKIILILICTLFA